MSDSPESAHFNYINLLGKLEEACREHKPRLSSMRAGVERMVDTPLHFARLAGANARFAVSHVLARTAGRTSDFDNLSIEAKRLARIEGILLRNIHNYTSGRTSADRALGDIWPAPIPDGRVLERLIATTLGLASERRAGADDAEHLQVALQAAVRAVLLPALAWRLLCELHTYHETTREELRQRLIKRLADYAGPKADFILVEVEERKYRLGSLVLHRAWHDVLVGPACRLPSGRARRGLSGAARPRSGGARTGHPALRARHLGPREARTSSLVRRHRPRPHRAPHHLRARHRGPAGTHDRRTRSGEEVNSG